MCSSPTLSGKKEYFQDHHSDNNQLSHLHGWETNGHQEVCTPVDQNRHRHGCRPGALGEQLRRDHPGYGAGAHGEEHNVEEGGDYGEPPDPGDQFLETVNCIKSFPRTLSPRNNRILVFSEQ